MFCVLRRYGDIKVTLNFVYGTLHVFIAIVVENTVTNAMTCSIAQGPSENKRKIPKLRLL
jgi:hypothetical protein